MGGSYAPNTGSPSEWEHCHSVFSVHIDLAIVVVITTTLTSGPCTLPELKCHLQPTSSSCVPLTNGCILGKIYFG